MATITINGNSFDPLIQQDELKAFGLDSADVAESSYILLQTREPLTKDQKEQLRHLGVKILEYVPNDTYIAYYPPPDLSPLRALPFIQWAGIYPHQVKVEPALRPQPPGVPVPQVVNALAPPSASYDPFAHDPRTVEVVLHENAMPRAAREKIARVAGLDPELMQMRANKVRLTLSTDQLDQLAQIDEVRHIEEFSGYKLGNNVARGLIGVDAVQNGGGNAAFAGAGEVIAICDTGLDSGDPNNIHPAFRGRVAKLYALNRPTARDPNGHGTHVAGSALGDDVLTDGTVIRGTAPRATLVLQSILKEDDDHDIEAPADLNDLFAPPYNDDGARVHSNSWYDRRFMSRRKYTKAAREVDEFVWGHRDMVVCFGVGNEGVDESKTGTTTSGTVMPPSTAKNCIAVGASESRRPELLRTYNLHSPGRFPAPPIANDLLSDNPEGVVAFSGRGLTLDNRFKPDLMAPGCIILSAKSSCAPDSDIFGKSPDGNYIFDAGTSMATPLVAGCAAVVRESFRVRRGINPSAALVKAMLINGATQLAGQYEPPELGPIPNESEGFGRVNLAASLAPEVGNEQVAFWDEETALDSKEEKSHTFAVPAGAAGLKVTLVWTDPPGEKLQNDLDLIVRDTSVTERHGNQPPNTAAFDRDNNVEQVIWTNIAPGNAQIIVRSFRITAHKQTYALVARAY